MNRSAMLTLFGLLVLIAALWIGGPWLWKGLLALHGRH
jgi:hypothetical protein